MEIKSGSIGHRGQSAKALAGGFAALAVAMGIGRFGYTPILPLMQFQAHLSVTEAGYLASSNYLGYLIGAFLGGLISWGAKRAFHLRTQILLCIVTTGLMGLTSSFIFWFILRLISGISSGLIFVLASSLVFDVLVSENRLKWAGLLYAGVGMGIAISGLTVSSLHSFTWKGAWIGLGVVASVLIAPVWTWIREYDPKKESRPQTKRALSTNVPSVFGWLVAAYGLEGLGYIVSATFLVALVKEIPHMAGFAEYTWVIVGLAAVPSTIVWSWCAERKGHIQALMTALLLQAIGVVLPVWSPNVLGITLGAILFGGTFLGITAMSMTAARLMRSTKANEAIGLMTGFFGIGQILGPIGAGIAAKWTHSYSLSLILAAFIIGGAVGLLLIGWAVDRNVSTGRP